MHWQAQTLGDTLSRNAELFPQQEALVIGEDRLTYGELHVRVAEMARGLRAMGVKRGDHVAVCMGNTVEWVVFFYAAATVGAVTVPVNTRFKADELAYCLKQADVKLSTHHRALRSRLWRPLLQRARAEKSSFVAGV